MIQYIMWMFVHLPYLVLSCATLSNITSVVHTQYFCLKYFVPKYIFVSLNTFYLRAPLYANFGGIINYNQLHFQGLKKQLIKNTSSSQENPQIEKLMRVACTVVKVMVNQVHDQIQSRGRKVKEWRSPSTSAHSIKTTYCTYYHYQNCNLEIHIIDFVLLSPCTYPRTANPLPVDSRFTDMS